MRWSIKRGSPHTGRDIWFCTLPRGSAFQEGMKHQTVMDHKTDVATAETEMETSVTK